MTCGLPGVVFEVVVGAGFEPSFVLVFDEVVLAGVFAGVFVAVFDVDDFD
jgi:hypothetical protein